MTFNSELNNFFNLGLLIIFASLWIFCVLYFWVSYYTPSFRSTIKLKDDDLSVISNFTMLVSVGLFIGLGVISSLFSDLADTVGYLYALISTLAFCVIWRYVKTHEVENG